MKIAKLLSQISARNIYNGDTIVLPVGREFFLEEDPTDEEPGKGYTCGYLLEPIVTEYEEVEDASGW
jgi:hypothetical protein